MKQCRRIDMVDARESRKEVYFVDSQALGSALSVSLSVSKSG
ncbi:hypothetical protein TNCV_1552531, partial [Trichonephila clavipes]